MAMGTRSRGQVPSTNRPRLSVRSSYEDFKPLIESKEDADAHSVHIHLPGFFKEQIRIVAESNRNMLRVRGERFVSGSTWNRFQEEIPVPENCDITETRAKFEGGVLRITMPKRITAVASETSSPTELSSEAATPERSPLATSRPVLPPNQAPLRPSLPTPSQAAPTPRPLPTPAQEPRPSSLRPTKMPEITRPENLPPSRTPRTEDLPSQRMPAAAHRSEALPPPRMPEPRMSPSYQPIPSPPQQSRPAPQPTLPHPDAARFTPNIYPKPRENERSRFESSQGPSLPQPPLGLLQALPQPEPAKKDPIAERWRTESDQAPMRDPIGSERRRNETDPAQVRDPIGPERRRIESDQAPIRNPIGSEKWRNESDPARVRDPVVPERRRIEQDLAPMRDPIVPERRRTEPDPEAMRDPIDLKRRRIETETPLPLKKPVTSTIADLPGKAPTRYESLTEEEKRRFGLRGMRLRGLEEDRQLLVNMGVAVLVLVSFGAWISYSFGASPSAQPTKREIYQIFMSILPSHNQGSASDYPSPALRNPNNHGFLPPTQKPSSPEHPHTSSDSSVSPTDDSPALAALRISGHEASPPALNAHSGSIAQPAPDDRGGSSREVRGFGRSNARNHMHYSSTGRKAENPVGGDGIAQTSSRRVSGSTGSPPNPRSVGSAGRRAQMVNGNHLLNFHYDPISRSQPRAALGPLRKPRFTGKEKAYNKDLFVQANYKFVVLDAGNYDVDYLDPDKMLEWEDIICVKHTTPYPVQCPICLETPLCPQITSCGHIFCFPCILQYLLMGEEDLKQECRKKCPLCFLMISSKELYTINIELVKHYQVGDTVEFTLLVREKDSFALNPKKQDTADAAPFDQFSKFILTSDVELSVREAMCDLDSWLARADSGLVDDLEKLPYVCAAMEQLKKRKKYWNERRTSGGRKDIRSAGCDGTSHPRSAANTIKVESQTSAVETHSFCVDSNEQDEDEGSREVLLSEVEKAIDEKDISLSTSYNSKTVEIHSCHSCSTKGKESYNFYQVVDGQNVIIHPLNMKCLLHHYGSYDMLPPRITGKIVELESVTQSDAIRKRYRFLSHFPLTATLQFCEIDMGGTLPADSLSPFIDQIKKREKLRKQLAKKEQSEKIKAEAIMGYYGPAMSYSPSFYDGEPTFSMDDFEALGSDRSAASRSPHVYEERNLFSSVARLGFAAGHDSPSLTTRQASTGSSTEQSTSCSTTPPGNRGVMSFASVISRDRTEETRSVAKINETKKGKKASRVLLSNAGIRRY